MHANFSGCLNYYIDEMCQMNIRIRHIEHQQARIGGFGPSPSPSPEASPDDDKGDVDPSGDDEMTTSQ